MVRLANKYGTPLPDNTFYDAAGNITTDPTAADAVLPFGDYKGFALALWNEVATGALLGMPMMILNDAGNNFGEKIPDRGAYILVIDPAQTVGLTEFKTRVSEYIGKILATQPLPDQKIRIPGQEAMQKARKALQNDQLELPEELWQELSKST